MANARVATAVLDEATQEKSTNEPTGYPGGQMLGQLSGRFHLGVEGQTDASESRAGTRPRATETRRDGHHVVRVETFARAATMEASSVRSRSRCC